MIQQHEKAQSGHGAQTPFVFQVTAALRKFMLEHGGEQAVDFSIGTPPTSEGIRAKQMEILFGCAESPFDKDSLEDLLFTKLSEMVARMGVYEAAGGRDSLKKAMEDGLPEGFGVTIISGGGVKALDLWLKVKEDFDSAGDALIINRFEQVKQVLKERPVIMSTPIMERCGLAFFIGKDEFVKAMQSLHTALLGTPSAPQEDLLVFLSDPLVQDYLENALINEDNPSCLTDTLEFLALIYKEPLKVLAKEGIRLKHTFGRQFFICNFDGTLGKQKEAFALACGNGGGRQALYNIEDYLHTQGVASMVIFQPHWTYSNVYRNTELVFVPAGRSMGNGLAYQPDLEAVEKVFKELSVKGRVALTINSPNNPLGTVYSRASLEALLVLCERYKVFLIDDACYLHILRKTETERANVLAVACAMVDQKKLSQDFLKNIFVALTASKGLGMAGGRLGAIVTADQKALVNFEDQYAHELPNVVAFFFASRLTEDRKVFLDLLQEINDEIDRRVAKVTKILDEHAIRYTPPSGAFYIQIEVPFLKDRVTDMRQFALEMAEKKGVAFMPMEVFGGEKYALRLSLGGEKTMEQLQRDIEILLTQLTASA